MIKTIQDLKMKFKKEIEIFKKNQAEMKVGQKNQITRNLKEKPYKRNEFFRIQDIGILERPNEQEVRKIKNIQEMSIQGMWKSLKQL